MKKLYLISYESFDDLQQTRQYMDSSDEKALMESLDPVIVELLNENVRLRGEIDRLKERLDNKARLMIYQEGYIDKQSQAIKSLKSDKYQKPKYQKKLKEADDRHKSRLKSLEASYLYREETLKIYIDKYLEDNKSLLEENKRLRNENVKLQNKISKQPIEQAKQIKRIIRRIMRARAGPNLRQAQPDHAGQRLRTEQAIIDQEAAGQHLRGQRERAVPVTVRSRGLPSASAKKPYIGGSRSA